MTALPPDFSGPQQATPPDYKRVTVKIYLAGQFGVQVFADRVTAAPIVLHAYPPGDRTTAARRLVEAAVADLNAFSHSMGVPSLNPPIPAVVHAISTPPGEVGNIPTVHLTVDCFADRLAPQFLRPPCPAAVAHYPAGCTQADAYARVLAWAGGLAARLAAGK